MSEETSKYHIMIDGVKHRYFIFSNGSGMPVDKQTYDEHKGYKKCLPDRGITDKEVIKNSLLRPTHPLIP